jgi:hypothetical protein
MSTAENFQGAHLLSPPTMTVPSWSIHNLPNELLHRICTFLCVPIHLPPSFNGSSTLWSLAHGSSRLRRILFSLPIFWERIKITVDRNRRRQIPSEAIQLILQKIGSDSRVNLTVNWLPLTDTKKDPWSYTGEVGASIYPYQPTSSSTGREVSEKAIFVQKALLSLCQPFSSRIRKFMMSFPDLGETYQAVQSGFFVMPFSFFAEISEVEMLFYVENELQGRRVHFPLRVDSRFFVRNEATHKVPKFFLKTAFPPNRLSKPRLDPEQDKKMNSKFSANTDALHFSDTRRDQHITQHSDAIDIPTLSWSPIQNLAHLSLSGFSLRQSTRTVRIILESLPQLQHISVGLDWDVNRGGETHGRLNPDELNLPARIIPRLRRIEVEVHTSFHPDACFSFFIRSVRAPELVFMKVVTSKPRPSHVERWPNFAIDGVRTTVDITEHAYGIPFDTIARFDKLEVLDLRRWYCTIDKEQVRAGLPSVRVLLARKTVARR